MKHSITCIALTCLISFTHCSSEPAAPEIQNQDAEQKIEPEKAAPTEPQESRKGRKRRRRSCNESMQIMNNEPTHHQ